MILIIGYGNPLRTDDAIGQRVAQALQRRIQSERVQVLTAFQLTPELVEPIRHVQRVIFIDARVGKVPGSVFQERIKPAVGTGAFTHNVTPATLLGAAHEWYGATPIGTLISIVGASFDYGSELSLQLSTALPRITDKVHEIVVENADGSLEGEHARV